MAPSCEFNKGKGKEDIENIIDEMNKTWKRNEDCSTSNGEGSLHPMGQEITPHQTKQSRVMWDWYLKDIYHKLVPKDLVLKILHNNE